MDALERFWLKVKKTDDCWIWIAGLSPDGYGKFKAFGKTFRATRFIWTHMNGAIPEGQQILHACDNRLCVRPDHLHLGSHKENMREAALRQRMVSGEQSHLSKFTAEQVREIRRSTEPQKVLAKRYGVWQGAISHIKCGRNWSHLT